MNRIEFSHLLSNARKHLGVGKNELCRLTKFTFVQLQLIEDNPNNFALDKAIVYLQGLNCRLVLVKDTEAISISSISDISLWLKSARKGKYTQRGLASLIHCSYPTIANIERQAHKVSIDLFLKLVDALAYNIKIEKI